MKKFNPEIKSSDHLSSEELLRYHRRTLTGKETGAVEKHLSKCDLCSDAMKGIAEMRDSSNINFVTLDLKRNLRKRLSARKKIYSRLDIISTIMVIAVLGLIILVAFYFMYLKW